MSTQATITPGVPGQSQGLREGLGMLSALHGLGGRSGYRNIVSCLPPGPASQQLCCMAMCLLPARPALCLHQLLPYRKAQLGTSVPNPLLADNHGPVSLTLRGPVQQCSHTCALTCVDTHRFNTVSHTDMSTHKDTHRNTLTGTHINMHRHADIHTRGQTQAQRHTGTHTKRLTPPKGP